MFHVCFVIFIVCLYICVCKCLFQNNILVSNVHCGSAVRFCQALLGFLITAHHLYASLMLLCGGITNQKPKTSRMGRIEIEVPNI